jgi:hypothetical protein
MQHTAKPASKSLLKAAHDHIDVFCVQGHGKLSVWAGLTLLLLLLLLLPAG